MLYTRALLALALWGAAAVVAFLAIRSVSISPCDPHDGFSWFVVGVGVLTAAGVIQLLSPKAFDRRGFVAALLAVVLGAAAGLGLWLLSILIWAGHCTA
jgi:hypothetical protein